MSRPDIEIVVSHLLMYRELGFSCIPLSGKLPINRWKDYEFSMRDFLAPHINIGIRAGLLPSGDWLWMCDLDRKELLAELYNSNPALTNMPLCSTSHGWHLYGTWKSEPRTQHLVGMDLIANGYCVAAPSIHPDGHQYRWIISPRGLPSCYNPEWLEGISPPQAEASRTAPTPIVFNVPGVLASESWGAMPGSVPKGQRHNSLISYLGALHTACFTEEEALARALDWNAKCSPPLTRQEVAHTVRTCWGEWDIYKVNKGKGG